MKIALLMKMTDGVYISGMMGRCMRLMPLRLLGTLGLIEETFHKGMKQD